MEGMTSSSNRVLYQVEEQLEFQEDVGLAAFAWEQLP